MSDGAGGARRLDHRSLERTGSGEPVVQARERLGDRDRVALLLEAASLLSHCAAADWAVEGGLAASRVEKRSLRVRAAPRRGATQVASPRDELLALATALWGERVARLSGRGEGRAVARRLIERWRSTLGPISADRIVEDILDAAPFLWSSRYGPSRESLRAQVSWPARCEERLAGPPSFARRLRIIATPTRTIRQVLGSADCERLWQGRAAPPGSADPTVWAAALVRRGRFVAAQRLVAEGVAGSALVIEARCCYELGATSHAAALVRSASRHRLGSDASGSLALLQEELRRDSGAVPTSPAPACWRERRAWPRSVAARRWGALVHERRAADDLRGAERAARHAFLLASSCDPARDVRAAREDFVAILVRRGRLAEARRRLESLDEDGDADRGAAAVESRVLRALWLLAHGRAAAALDALRLEARAADERATPIERALAVRALLWLGRVGEARLQLAAAGTGALEAAFEPEERPAILALVGRRDEAFQAVAGGGGRLWRAVLIGQVPSAEEWAGLRRIERYRAARWVVDLETVAPGVVPLYWRRRASADLRRVGAVTLAERIEGSSGSEPWNALAGFLARQDGAEEAVGELFARAGYPEARLTLEGSAGARALCGGGGGREEMSATVAAGTLRLGAPLLDAVLRALFAAVVAMFAPRAVPAPTATRPEPPAERSRFAGLTGASPGFCAALARAEALAAGRLPVLIRGETGTGKERVARLVHDRSPRAAAAFLPINCAALSETLVLSDLFGHVRGAFTGAERDRPGVFESARGGTVFLDEIGDLPSSAQGMLLRVLQSGEVRRLGESVARHVDVRVVTATHRDLSQLVAQGTFRQDLFFRLAAAEVELPPLRARGDDLWLLVEEFLTATASGARLSSAARQRLREHSWPGNVRELENAIAVAAALAAGATIEVAHLPSLVAGTATAVDLARRGDSYHEQVEDFRRQLVSAAVAASGGNLAAAARRLGLTRQALSYLARQLRLN